MSENSALNNLLNAAVSVQDMETEKKVCPEVEANATIRKYAVRTGTSEKMVRNDNPEGIWASLSITWVVDSEEAREELGRDEVFVNQDVFLAVKNGVLSTSDNQDLAVLLNLFGIKGEMTAREMFDELVGQSGFVKVKHEPYKDKVTAKIVSVAELQ